MEQLLGVAPYRFEVVDSRTARIVEAYRKGFFGQWTVARRRLGWVSCSAVEGDLGTLISIEASAGRAPRSRALQLVNLLQRGLADNRTVYRVRRLPPGPVTLVASWAGMPYQLFNGPHLAADRGPAIYTATPLWAVCGGEGSFVRVRMADGHEGYVERDEVVAAPAQATRRAQLDAARFV